MSSSLRDRTLELLIGHNEDLKTISNNSNISLPWLDKFRYNTPKNPGVATVQKLYEYLTGEALLDE